MGKLGQEVAVEGRCWKITSPRVDQFRPHMRRWFYKLRTDDDLLVTLFSRERVIKVGDRVFAVGRVHGHNVRFQETEVDDLTQCRVVGKEETAGAC